MPIKIPADLPARKALENENIFVMTDSRALQQDIRPIEIVIVNLMPTKIATETQLLRLLGNTPLQVNITLLRTADYTPKNTPAKHLERFYKTFNEILNFPFDGMIVTGAPVEHLEFKDVAYWNELLEIIHFASNRVYSTLYICWAAQAALYHYYQIPKYNLPAKISGIFKHNILQRECALFRGFDEYFYAPHSRHTEIKTQDLEQIKNLRILCQAEGAGLAIAESIDRSQVFITGHLEYDSDTLEIEYLRDQKKGLNPKIPTNYYPNNNTALKPQMLWRAHAHLFFSNWLNYYVYQEVPYQFLDT